MSLLIHVRYYGGAYIARCNGKTASCTGCPEWAARSAAEKAGAGKHARIVRTASQAPDRDTYEVHHDLQPAKIAAP